MADKQSFNELALFAGAGGGILGGKLLGWRTICAVERDAYPAAVLAQRQNDGLLEAFPIWSDVTTFDGKPWRGIVDVISGGFPCQAFSTAARGRNTAINMWPEMLRIIGEVRPSRVFTENVAEKPILLAQRDLEACGYKTKRINLNASDLGADHIRSRWWLLAYADNESELHGGINAEVGMLPEIQGSFWEANPFVGGVHVGDSFRVDRFKCTGNIQVPIVAATAFRILSEGLIND